MRCAKCGTENRDGASFCNECAAPFELPCPRCGAKNKPGVKFCDECGTRLSARSAHATEKAEARKVVTIVFADLIGSTSLHERLDPESVSRVMERYHNAVRAPVEA